MNRSVLKVSLILACTLGACNEQPPQLQSRGDSLNPGTQAAPGSATGDPSVVHHPEPPARPAQKPDSMQLEGMWEPFTARLVQPNTDLPFSTYLPKGMEFEQQSSGEGEGFYFHSAFPGRQQEAFMLMFMAPQGASAADVDKLAAAFKQSRSNPKRITRIQLGSYHNRHFYVAYSYPYEFADGMGPRTHYIRTQWIWLNDGKSLESTLQSPLE
jgi:hypothetical protein